MLAEEARCAADHAFHAARHAKAAAELAVAGLGAVHEASPVREAERAMAPAPQWEEMAPTPQWEEMFEPLSRHPQAAQPGFAGEPIPIVREAEGQADDTLQFGGDAVPGYAMEAEAWRETEYEENVPAFFEPAQGVHANLIEFPRELVATRKVRPRLAEGAYAAPRSAQLSIFEVDPAAVATTVEPVAEGAAPAWNTPGWSSIELEAQPVEEIAEEALPPSAVAAAEPTLEQAPMSRRLLAIVVDCTLIGAALVAGGVAVAAHVGKLPSPRMVEISASVAFVAIAALYELFFFTLAAATPGMKYAQIQLATFSNERPLRAQRWHRLTALLLSALPLGLGLVWALFDERRLSWHDRLSQTYLRGNC